MNTFLNFKQGLPLLLLFFLIKGNAQNDSLVRQQAYVQIKGGWSIPSALGNNFLSEAYDIKNGFVFDSKVVFPKDRFYMGWQANFFKAEVTDLDAVGGFDRTNVTHLYLTGGIPLLGDRKTYGVDAGLGLGYGLYANRRDAVRFSDEAFSVLLKAAVYYRWTKAIGIHGGVQFARDFLGVRTAPELRSFFRNANILYVNLGFSIHINERP